MAAMAFSATLPTSMPLVPTLRWMHVPAPMWAYVAAAAFLICAAQSFLVRSTGMGCFFFLKKDLPSSLGRMGRTLASAQKRS